MARKVYDADYDFIGFTYNGYHSIDDLKIYRISDGDRYNLNITPTSKDVTAEMPDGDGMYFFETWHTKKDFQIKFAFDDLNEADIRKLTTLFSGMEEHELIFDEWPYKAYDAVVDKPVQIDFVCFDGPNGERIYKGEGTVSFICYKPYAHTPKKSNKIKGSYLYTHTFPINLVAEPGYHVIQSTGTMPQAIRLSTVEHPDYFVSDVINNKTAVFRFEKKTQISAVTVMFNGALDANFEATIKLILHPQKQWAPDITLVDDLYNGFSPSNYGGTLTKN